MRTLLYRALILLAVIGLILTPPVLSGYAELQRADSAMDAGSFSDAAKFYERVVRLLPWRQDLYEQVAILHFRIGNTDDAILWFERAKKHNALSARGWDFYGATYWVYGLDSDALKVWLAGLDAYPSYYEFYYYIALAHRGLKNYPEQQQALEMWVTVGEPVSPMSHYEFGLLLSLSDPDRALGEFLLAASLDPQYDSVVQTMDTTLMLASLETDESRRMVIIGRGLGLLNEWSLGAQAFRQAVAANGENAEAWAWLGEAEQQLGQEGRVELDKALALERENPIVRSLRGVYWMRQNRPQQALAEYLLAAEYDPKNPAWQISIGEAYAQNGDLQAALSAYMRATENAPTDATVWRLLANFNAEYNMQVEDVGLPAAQMAVELSGENPLALDTLGWTLALLERYDEARDTLEHALSLDPELAQAHLHLGIVTFQLNDWEVALDHLQQARDLDPDGPAGKHAQLLLNQYYP